MKTLREKAIEIAKLMEDGKGKDVVLLNISELNSRISGQSTVGDKNYFGSRCFIAQCLRVGNENRFGAGTYILRKIKDHGFYMGNPAKKVDIG